jgi:hypothetical protein
MPDLVYRGVILPEDPGSGDLAAAAGDYAAIASSVMNALADRYDRSPGYPFLDTKLDLITGRDFPAEDPVRGRDAVYCWIQGRGLEALAGHRRWWRDHPDPATDPLLPRLADMMREVLDALRDIRRRNAGRLFFFVTPEGIPFVLDEEGAPRPHLLSSASPLGFSDLFCAKGMYAAARDLEDAGVAAIAKDYCRQVDAAIRDGSFESDQQPLDPKNPVGPVPGRRTHGHYMIQIGAAALIAAMEGDPAAVEMGLRLIRHELDHHVNLDRRVPELPECDFWEAIDARGGPFVDSRGRVLSDPGHALEFVGLTLKFTASVKRRGLATPEQLAEIARVEARMPRILERNFRNGFQPGPGGICKAFDLVSRQPINRDMPWWSLPETMRAAARCWAVAPDPEDRRASLGILSACHNAFLGHYVRPDLHLMAYQTRSAEGRPVAAIPATSDADPGYHTGLCLIDILDVFEQNGVMDR